MDPESFVGGGPNPNTALIGPSSARQRNDSDNVFYFFFKFDFKYLMWGWRIQKIHVLLKSGPSSYKWRFAGVQMMAQH